MDLAKRQEVSVPFNKIIGFVSNCIHLAFIIYLINLQLSRPESSLQQFKSIRNLLYIIYAISLIVIGAVISNKRLDRAVGRFIEEQKKDRGRKIDTNYDSQPYYHDVLF